MELRDKLRITKQGRGEKWTARQKESDKTGRASINRAGRERESERGSWGEVDKANDSGRGGGKRCRMIKGREVEVGSGEKEN